MYFVANGMWLSIMVLSYILPPPPLFMSSLGGAPTAERDVQVCTCAGAPIYPVVPSLVTGPVDVFAQPHARFLAIYDRPYPNLIYTLAHRFILCENRNPFDSERGRRSVSTQVDKPVWAKIKISKGRDKYHDSPVLKSMYNMCEWIFEEGNSVEIDGQKIRSRY